MKLLVTRGFSRSLLSRSTCGYLACSRRKCQKFARNDPQRYPENLHPTVVPGDERKSPPDRFSLQDTIGFDRSTGDLSARTNQSKAANDLLYGNRSFDQDLIQFKAKIAEHLSDRRSRIRSNASFRREKRIWTYAATRSPLIANVSWRSEFDCDRAHKEIVTASKLFSAEKICTVARAGGRSATLTGIDRFVDADCFPTTTFSRRVRWVSAKSGSARVSADAIELALQMQTPSPTSRSTRAGGGI